MIDKKTVDMASQVAAAHMSDLLSSVHTEETKDSTVYSEVYNRLIKSCCLNEEIIRARITIWAQKHYKQNDVQSVVGNIMKEATNPNMGRKVFMKLVEAIFHGE